MADISDFQGTVKIRAKSEEVVAKIIALNSVAQLNTHYDTQFQDFETTRHLSPDQALKDILSKLTFEKTSEGVECKDLKIYGNGRYSIRHNLSWFLENLLDYDAKIPAYKAMQSFLSTISTPSTLNPILKSVKLCFIERTVKTAKKPLVKSLYRSHRKT